MAQVARAASTGTAATVTGSRLAAGARNVATVERGPVEEINPKLGASLDDGAHLFREFTRGGSSPKSQSPAPGLGMVRATSQAFAAFLEFEGAVEHAGGAGVAAGSPSLSAVMTRAINAYETNARVISGTNTRLGSSVSLSL